ncbi:MAG: hypothetical protein RBR53_02115 [Desulforegulaceae bacterium]|nr:hypothetical protein [Desulforegulaceae bacterium]
MKKNTYFLFFKFFFVFFINSVQSESWKQRENSFFKQNSNWIKLEENKKFLFYARDKSFFLRDLGWQTENNSWVLKDKKWMDTEKEKNDKFN